MCYNAVLCVGRKRSRKWHFVGVFYKEAIKLLC